MSRTVTFTAWKRRITIGTKLLCVEQTHQPKLVGETRVVNKVQTVGIRCDPNFWTRWPKAQHVTMVDADTAKWPLWPDRPEKIVALRILRGAELNDNGSCANVHVEDLTDLAVSTTPNVKTPAPDSALPWKLGAPNIYPKFKNMGYIVRSEDDAGALPLCACNGDVADGWKNAAYIITACNTFPDLVSTIQAVLFQMEHGEASDVFDIGVINPDTQRDLRWCREQLREALKNLS